MSGSIGTCELCGCTDHHLQDGVCPACLELHGPHMSNWADDNGEAFPTLDAEAAALGRAIVSDAEIENDFADTELDADELPGGLTPADLADLEAGV